MPRRCDICGSAKKLEPDLKGTRLRGHLCMKCSDILALSGDDRLILQSAADYIEAFERTIESDL